MRFRSPLIKVPNNTAISQRTIERLIRRGDSCGIKKVARDPDSDAFRYLMRLQAEAHQGS